MNIHPLFVHFPIGLLVSYALLEIFSRMFPKIRAMAWIESTKTFLVIAGVVAAIPTLGTGDMASALLKPGSREAGIVETHELFASITFWLFVIIALAEYVRILYRRSLTATSYGSLTRIALRLHPYTRKILETPLAAVLGITGLVTVTIAGGLGAAMGHGIDVDPIVTFIYRLFF